MLLEKKRIPYKWIFTYGLLPSFLKKLIYRLRGYTINRNVTIGFGSIVEGKHVVLHEGVRISPFVVIRSNLIEIDKGSSFGSFSFFDLVSLKIGKWVRIRESVMTGGNKSSTSSLEIGDNCLILQNTILNTTDSIKMGHSTAIGGGSRLFTHSSWLSVLQGYPAWKGKITIGNNVWIPYDTTILSGVNIGDHVIITPRTIIDRDIPSYSIAGGQPLRVGKNIYYHELTVDRINEIMRGLVNELVCLLSFDGFIRLGNEPNLIFLTNKSHKIVIADSYETVIQDDKISLLNYKRSVVFFTTPITDSVVLPGRLPVVKIEGIKPVVNNPNDLTNMILIFLSRYGIR